MASITFPSQSAGEYELEFARGPVAGSGVSGLVGYSADRAALMFGASKVYVIPVVDNLGLTVHRVLPAKSSGGS